MADLGERLEYHCGVAGSMLKQSTAGLGHFWAANADELDVVTSLPQSSKQACTVGVGAWLSGTDEDAILFGFLRHNVSAFVNKISGKQQPDIVEIRRMIED